MSNKFTVAEADVRKRDGESYSISNYKEGEDYVERKCFNSSKRVFRTGIFGVSVVDPSLVEHRQEPRAMLELDDKGLRVVFPDNEDVLEDHALSEPECKEIEQSQVSGTTRDQVQECKVKRLYPNQRWVETDKGRVFVGLKGSSLKVGQIIDVLNGNMIVKFTGRKKTLVRI